MIYVDVAPQPLFGDEKITVSIRAHISEKEVWFAVRDENAAADIEKLTDDQAAWVQKEISIELDSRKQLTADFKLKAPDLLQQILALSPERVTGIDGYLQRENLLALLNFCIGKVDG